MISRAVVNNLVDEVEKDYLVCWGILCKMKNRSSSLTAEDMLGFQPRLAESIFRLSEMYRSLHQEKRCLIGKKNTLDSQWFVQRLRLIKHYQDAISTVIAIGKVLGDSFAWFFYHREPSHLVKHLEHQRIYHAPPGIGGRGELEFIKRVQVIDGHFVVYHGITEILRLGDVSLIELKSFKLAAIAELKTQQVGPQELRVLMAITAKGQKLMDRLEKQTCAAQQARQNVAEPALPKEVTRRLDKQVRQITDSFGIAKPGANVSSEMLSNASTLEALFECSRRAASCKVGNSQVLVRIPLSGKCLLNRIAAEPEVALSELNLVDLTRQIMVDRRDDNALYIASIHSPSPDQVSMPGFMPLFWFPLSTSLIEELLFYRCRIISIYNPGPFLQGIRKLGFNVQVSGREYTATRSLGDRVVTLEGIRYFMEMIARQFLSEESVLQLLQQAMLTAEEQGIEVDTRIQLEIMQLLYQSPD